MNQVSATQYCYDPTGTSTIGGTVSTTAGTFGTVACTASSGNSCIVF